MEELLDAATKAFLEKRLAQLRRRLERRQRNLEPLKQNVRAMEKLIDMASGGNAYPTRRANPIPLAEIKRFSLSRLAEGAITRVDLTRATAMTTLSPRRT